MSNVAQTLDHDQEQGMSGQQNVETDSTVLVSQNETGDSTSQNDNNMLQRLMSMIESLAKEGRENAKEGRENSDKLNEKIGSLNTDIGRLNTDMNEKIGNLGKDMNNKMENLIIEVNKKINDNTEQMNNSLDKFGGEINKINEKLDNIDVQLTEEIIKQVNITSENIERNLQKEIVTKINENFLNINDETEKRNKECEERMKVHESRIEINEKEIQQIKTVASNQTPYVQCQTMQGNDLYFTGDARLHPKIFMARLRKYVINLPTNVDLKLGIQSRLKGEAQFWYQIIEEKYSKLRNKFVVALNQLKNGNGIYSEVQIKHSQKKLREYEDIMHRKQKYRGYKIKDGFVIKEVNDSELYVIDEELACLIISNLHEQFGHLGVRKTWSTFRENYYCKRDLQVTKEVIKMCHICCLGKNKNYVNKSKICSIVTTLPLELVAIDYLSNLIQTKENNKNVLIVIDYFTKFIKLYATKRCNTNNTVQLIKRYCKEVGKPSKILADNATYFQNERFQNKLQKMGIDVVYTTIRHPKANPSERYIQEVLRFLRIMTNGQHDSWDCHLEGVERYLNDIKNTVTGISPIILMLGKQPDRPWLTNELGGLEQLYAKAKKRIKDNADRYIKRANSKVKKQMIFKIGDRVIVKRLKVSDPKNKVCAKLCFPYEGPFIINKVLNENTYELKCVGSELIRGKFHVELLYPYL